MAASNHTVFGVQFAFGSRPQRDTAVILGDPFHHAAVHNLGALAAAQRNQLAELNADSGFKLMIVPLRGPGTGTRR